MKKISAFALMDMDTIRPYFKSAAFVLVIGIGLGFVLKSVLMPVLMILLCVILVSSYPFAVAEKNGMDTLYAVLPAGRSAAVAGRYLFALGVLIAGMLLALAATLAVNAVFPAATTAQTAAQIAGYFAVGLLVLSLQYPVYFRFGYNRAKFAAMLPTLALSLGCALVGTLLPGFAEKIMLLFSSPAFAVLTPLSALLLFGLSLALSCRLYGSRDL